MNFIDDGTDEEHYKLINQTILDGNVMNIYLVVMVRKYGAIDADDSSCHGYYIIKFSSSPYTVQADLSIVVQVISYVEMVCEEPYLFPININLHYYVIQKQNQEHIVSISKRINRNISVICYNFKGCCSTIFKVYITEWLQ